MTKRVASTLGQQKRVCECVLDERRDGSEDDDETEVLAAAAVAAVAVWLWLWQWRGGDGGED